MKSAKNQSVIFAHCPQSYSPNARWTCRIDIARFWPSQKACLAQALTPFASVDELKAELANFMPLFEQHYLALMRQRLGWTATREDDAEQIDALLQLMQASGADYHLTLRQLAEESLRHRVHSAS